MSRGLVFQCLLVFLAVLTAVGRVSALLEDIELAESESEELGGSGEKYTSMEAKYHSTHKLLQPTSTTREFRRGLTLLEEIALGYKGRIGRISADALADLAYVHLFGSHGKSAVAQSPAKAFILANQSAHHGSPKGRHLMAFLLKIGIGIPGVPDMIDTESASWNLELLAAEQNYLPAMMAAAYRYMYHDNDCESALRLYRAAAITAVARVDATFFGDYASLRPLAPPSDELGDDIMARVARDTETVEYWHFHAERKDARALYEIGKMYQLGLWGTTQDLQQAVDFFRRAAAAGHAGAQGELGRLLTIGHGCELNLGQALKHLQQAVESPLAEPNANLINDGERGSELGDTGGGGGASDPFGQSHRDHGVAAASLGNLLNRRIFESEDVEMGVRYLRQAAAAGSLDAEFDLGQAELLDGRLEAALHHFQRGERRDHVHSMLALAQQYELSGIKGSAWMSGASGSSGKLSEHHTCKTVAKLYKRVAEVGPWLDTPYGPRQALKELLAGRESEALLMYLLASGEGYEIPHYNVAWMLLRNKGTGSSGVSGSAIASSAAALRNRKHATALQLLQILSVMNPGHSWAALHEGDLHLRGGRSVSRNVSAAAQCYERSAAGGNVLAMERLAVQLMHGTGLRQDDQRAQKLIRMALVRVGQEGSGLRGIAALVKKAELLYRLALMSFTGMLRAFLSGKWLKELIFKQTGKALLLQEREFSGRDLTIEDKGLGESGPDQLEREATTPPLAEATGLALKSVSTLLPSIASILQPRVVEKAESDGRKG